MPKKKKKSPKKSVKRRKPARKKPVKKKTARRKAAGKPAKIKKPKIQGNVIGIVTHYFPKVRAAVIKLKAPLTTGDVIKIKGHTTDFTQQVNSLQIDHVPVNQAKKGAEIGLLVNSRVRQHDTVLKV